MARRISSFTQTYKDVGKSFASSAIGRWEQSKETARPNSVVGEQDQSPGTSVYFGNFSWLKDSELLFLALVAPYFRQHQEIRTILLLELPSKIENCESLGVVQKAILLRWLQDHLKRKLGFYKTHTKKLIKVFSKRRILGILNDPTLQRRVLSRFRVKVVRPKKLGKTRTLPNGTKLLPSRHRGYRDHGTYSAPHQFRNSWISNDWTFDRKQWELDFIKEFNLEFYQAALHRPFNEVFVTGYTGKVGIRL